MKLGKAERLVQQTKKLKAKGRATSQDVAAARRIRNFLAAKQFAK